MIRRFGESEKLSITTDGSGAFGSASGVGRLSTCMTVWPFVVRRNIVARTCCFERSSVAQTNMGQRPGVGVAFGPAPTATGVAVGQGRFRLDHWNVMRRERVCIEGTEIG